MSDSKFNSFLEEELSQAPWTWNHIELLITLKHAMEIQKLCILFSKENSISNLFNTGTCFKPWQVCVQIQQGNLKMVTTYSKINNYIGFPENGNHSGQCQARINWFWKNLTTITRKKERNKWKPIHELWYCEPHLKTKSPGTCLGYISNISYF